MSGRKWKPGDVAMVSAYNRREEYRAYYDGKTWREYGADMFCVDEPMTLRPLLVIEPSPEMEDQGGTAVAGWFREIAKADGRRGVLAAVVHLAQQIEAQSIPPKPAEPAGLGAVVEDAKGWRWIRVYGDTNFEWQYLNKRADYDDVNAIRVLSEGVDA